MEKSRVPHSATRMVDIRDGIVHFNRDIQFPTRPHCGIIGVAPPLTHPDVPVLFAGDHGGNMDNTLMGPGSKVYFPIWALGGLLAIGDVHGAMGDGEMLGSPVEVRAECQVRLDVLETTSPLEGPVVETASQWATTGWSMGEDIEGALQMAAERMHSLLCGSCQLTYDEALILMTSVVDLELSVACLGVGFVSAKAVLPKLSGMKPLVGR